MQTESTTYRLYERFAPAEVFKSTTRPDIMVQAFSEWIVDNETHLATLLNVQVPDINAELEAFWVVLWKLHIDDAGNESEPDAFVLEWVAATLRHIIEMMTVYYSKMKRAVDLGDVEFIQYYHTTPARFRMFMTAWICYCVYNDFVIGAEIWIDLVRILSYDDPETIACKTEAWFRAMYLERVVRPSMTWLAVCDFATGVVKVQDEYQIQLDEMSL